MNAPAVHVRGARLAYRGVLLFENLDLTLKAGQLTCLLGPSGIGKTSLLRMIAGLLTPSAHEQFSATIECDNQRPVAEQIAYLAQTDLLLPWFNALDNATIGYRLRGTLTADIIADAKKLWAAVGLAPSSLHKKPAALSGGMRQRVALVRTLLEDKPILLMDEPFSSLDAITRFELQTLAAHLLKGRTVLLVTHDPLEALRLADEIYILAHQPAELQLSAQLTTPTPRRPDCVEVIHYQTALFHSLTQAKALGP